MRTSDLGLAGFSTNSESLGPQPTSNTVWEAPDTFDGIPTAAVPPWLVDAPDWLPSFMFHDSSQRLDGFIWTGALLFLFDIVISGRGLVNHKPHKFTNLHQEYKHMTNVDMVM